MVEWHYQCVHTFTISPSGGQYGQQLPTMVNNSHCYDTFVLNQLLLVNDIDIFFRRLNMALKDIYINRYTRQNIKCMSRVSV